MTVVHGCADPTVEPGGRSTWKAEPLPDEQTPDNAAHNQHAAEWARAGQQPDSDQQGTPEGQSSTAVDPGSAQAGSSDGPPDGSDDGAAQSGASGALGKLDGTQADSPGGAGEGVEQGAAPGATADSDGLQADSPAADEGTGAPAVGAEGTGSDHSIAPAAPGELAYAEDSGTGTLAPQETTGADTGEATGDADVVDVGSGQPGRSDEEKFNRLLARLERPETASSTAGAPTGPTADEDAGGPASSVGPTSDNAAADDGSPASMPDAAGETVASGLPAPPPLPDSSDVGPVEGIVTPEVESDTARVTGLWRQIGGGNQPDFLLGGYVTSEIEFLTDGTLRVTRTFDAAGGITFTWRISFEWDDGHSELTIGQDADMRPDEASLRGFTIPTLGVEATSATQDLPCALNYEESERGEIVLEGKTYSSVE